MPSTWVKVLLSATPVTIPGRAIGRITRNEIVSRPKKRWRATASEARVPSTIAIAVAASPAFSEVSNASWAKWSFDRLREPVEGQSRRRPFEDVAGVEGVDRKSTIRGM